MLPPAVVFAHVKAGPKKFPAVFTVKFDLESYAVEAVESATPVCEQHAIEGLRAWLKEIRG